MGRIIYENPKAKHYDVWDTVKLRLRGYRMIRHGDKMIINGKKVTYSKFAGDSKTTYIYHIETQREYTEEEAWAAPPEIRRQLVIKYRKYGVWVDEVNAESTLRDVR